MACPSAQITTIVIESIHERYIVLMAMSLKIDSVTVQHFQPHIISSIAPICMGPLVDRKINFRFGNIFFGGACKLSYKIVKGLMNENGS